MKKFFCKIGLHSWVYFFGESIWGGGTAWHRGCRKCHKEEISLKAGNSFLYSEEDAMYRLPFMTKKEYDEKVKRDNKIIDTFR